jgi:hypothetical protein
MQPEPALRLENIDFPPIPSLHTECGFYGSKSSYIWSFVGRYFASFLYDASGLHLLYSPMTSFYAGGVFCGRRLTLLSLHACIWCGYLGF